MTYRTALFLAAGTAAFMSATPILAGTSSAVYMPSLHYPPQNDVVTQADRAPFQACSQLEKAAQIDPKDCGTYSRAEIAKLIAALDD